MDSVQPNKRFLTLLAVTFLLICALAGAFNYTIDPYGLFGSKRITGFNAIKPTATTRVRIAKPYMAAALGPRTVIGGNSRPELGLDPRSQCWRESDQPVFNVGIPGASFFAQTQYVRHAVNVAGAKRVLLGVDFFDFLDNVAKPQPKHDWNHPTGDLANRLDLVTGDAFKFRSMVVKIGDHLGSLFSLTAIADSVTTLASQNNPDAGTRRADGFNPGHDYRSIIRHEGQHILFEQKSRELASTLSQPDLGLFERQTRRSEALEALTDFLTWSQRRGIEVILFINPYHAHYLSLIDIAGKWPLFEQWKRDLARIASTHETPLWDFHTVDAYSTESPPPPNDRSSQLEWYWEPAHYRKEIGDMMISRMLGRVCLSVHASNSPGVRLSRAMIEGHLDNLRFDLRRYARAKPAEHAALEQLILADRHSRPR